METTVDGIHRNTTSQLLTLRRLQSSSLSTAINIKTRTNSRLRHITSRCRNITLITVNNIHTPSPTAIVQTTSLLLLLQQPDIRITRSQSSNRINTLHSLFPHQVHISIRPSFPP